MYKLWLLIFFVTGGGSNSINNDTVSSEVQIEVKDGNETNEKENKNNPEKNKNVSGSSSSSLPGSSSSSSAASQTQPTTLREFLQANLGVNEVTFIFRFC